MAEKINDKQLEEIKKGLEASGIASAEIDKLLKSINSSSKEVAAALIESFSALEKNKKLYQDTLQLSVDQERVNTRLNKETAQYNAERQEYLEKSKKLLEEEEQVKKRVLILEQKLKDTSQQLTEEEKKQLELDKKRLSGIPIELEQLKSKRDSLEKNKQLLEGELALNNKIQTSFEQQLGSLTGTSSIMNNIQAKGSISGAIFAQFAENAGKLLTTVNAGNAEFARTTGQIAERSINFGYGLSQFGIGFQELNKSAAQLYVTMSDFSNLNKSTQKDLAESAARMELLGVNTATTGKILNDLTKGMRMTAQEASRTNEYIAKVAIGIGVAPSKMAADFAAAMPKLQAYGKQGVEVFAQLQKQAKSLGMEMNTLMGIVGDTFDTFEGGARAAGKLNAILGGDYLNSVEMLNATESERVELLKRSFDMSGKNFDSLDKYEKKAIAASLGISDLNEASKLLGTSTADMTEDMQKQAATQEKLAEVQREAVEVTKKVEQIFNALLIAIRPIVSIIETLINVFTIVNDFFLGAPAIIAAVIAGFIFFGVTVASLAAPLITAATSLGTFLGEAAAAPAAAAPFAASIGTMAAAVASAITVVGAAAAEPVAALGLLILAAVFTSMALAIASIGVAAAGIGLGIMLAATGVAKLVESFKGLGDAAIPAALGMVAFTIALSYLMITLVGLAPASAIASYGLLAIGGAVLLFGGAIAVAAYGMSLFVDSMAKLIDSLVKLGSFPAAGFSAVTSAIADITKELKEVPEGKTITLNALNQTLTTARAITEEEIKPSKDFVKAVKDYYVAQKDSKESDKDPLINALKELKAMFAPKQQSNEPITVKLVLNDGQTLDGKLFGLQKAGNLIGGG